MPDNTPRNIETTLSDRALLLHLLDHAEHLYTTLEEFRPLLDLLKGGGGKPDMIGAAQLRRKFRRSIAPGSRNGEFRYIREDDQGGT